MEDKKSVQDVFLPPRLIVTGANDLLIEKHRGIYFYSSNKISIRCKMFVVDIEGHNLTIPFLGLEDLKVHGQMEQILLRREKTCIL